jgi:hypothetical protein
MPQNLRNGKDGFTSPPKEGMLWIFSSENSDGFVPGSNPRSWVPESKGFWSRYNEGVMLKTGCQILPLRRCKSRRQNVTSSWVKKVWKQVGTKEAPRAVLIFSAITYPNGQRQCQGEKEQLLEKRNGAL